MAAVAGADTEMWRDKVGVFTPSTPLATDVGIELFPAKPDYDKVKRDLAAAGYKGEKVVLLAATDFPAVTALCEVSADMFRKSGINLDYQAVDWGTVTQRRNSQEPPEHGGWKRSLHLYGGVRPAHSGDQSFAERDRSRGLRGLADECEAHGAANRWLDAAELSEQQRICREIETEFWRDPPYFPLGQFFQATAYRNSISQIPRGSFSLFWNVRKAVSLLEDMAKGAPRLGLSRRLRQPASRRRDCPRRDLASFGSAAREPFGAGCIQTSVRSEKVLRHGKGIAFGRPQQTSRGLRRRSGLDRSRAAKRSLGGARHHEPLQPKALPHRA